MRRLILVWALLCLITVGPGLCRTWYIKPDGTGDAPTIQAGVDSASAGDTVLVASGTYTWTGEGTGTLDGLVTLKSGVCLAGETGDPQSVTIDAEGRGRVFYCSWVDSSTVIRGLTITGGSKGDAGAIYCYRSEPRIRDCAFIGNQAARGAGAVHCWHSSALISDCLFFDNSGGWWSGALNCSESSPTVTGCVFWNNRSGGAGAIECTDSSEPVLRGCTFYGNSGAEGACVSSVNDSHARLENCILSFSTAGGSVSCDLGGTISIACCDVYGNGDGDYISCISDQCGIDGNFSGCPSFCNAGGGDFALCDESPCLPGNHPDEYDCGLIGALDVGCACGPTQTEPATWGAIKSRYR